MKYIPNNGNIRFCAECVRFFGHTHTHAVCLANSYLSVVPLKRILTQINWCWRLSLWSKSKIKGINWCGISICKLHKLRKSYHWHRSISFSLSLWTGWKSFVCFTTEITSMKLSMSERIQILLQISKTVMKRKSNQTHIHAIWHDYHLVLTLRFMFSAWMRSEGNFVNFDLCICRTGCAVVGCIVILCRHIFTMLNRPIETHLHTTHTLILTSTLMHIYIFIYFRTNPFW